MTPIHLQNPARVNPNSAVKLRPITRQIVLVVVAFWMVIGCLYLLTVILNAQKYNQPLDVSARLFLGNQGIYLCWALFNIAMIAAVRHLSAQPAAIRYVSAIALGGLVWVPINLFLDASLSDWTFESAPRSAAEIFNQTNFFSVFFVVMLYLTVVFSSLGWTFIERWHAIRQSALQLEKQAVADQLEMSDMRMRILKAQLSPHFLFNALGSISGLIRSATAAQANTAIQTLGDMLRFTLSTGEEPLIHLSAELEFTKNYLSLQKLRFGDRFECSINTEQVPTGATCPPFVLQTLIENAFIHGVEQRDEPSLIVAHLSVADDQLQLQVSNPLARQAPANLANNTLGLALSNLEKRLRLMFAERSSVDSKVVDDCHVASVSLPLVSALP